jgi:transposase InsO family protein
MIAACHDRHAEAEVSHLCDALEVSRSWYYARPKAQQPSEEDILLRDAIERLVLDHSGNGYRRITEHLRREGWTINAKRVLRVMRHESLLCRLKKRFVVTTDSAHPHPVYPNLLREARLERCDQAWVADITYIRLPRGFCFLAVLLDAFSRRCVGSHLSEEIDSKLTLAALEKAIEVRRPPARLIHHSDRGVQYANQAYVRRLTEIEATPSMSRVGNPYDNAKAESFFKTLKREEVYLNDYQTFNDAEQNLSRFIHDVYNTRRLHSSLKYLPPVEFESLQADDIITNPTGISL